MLLKPLTHLLSPGGKRGRLSVLIFHRVIDQTDPLFPDEVDRTRFDQLLTWVARWFRVLPLDHAVADLQRGTLPARALSITFDDGYADNALNAMPLLQRHGMTATFFVATSFLDGGRMWNDSVIESIRRHAGDWVDLRPLGLPIEPMPVRSLLERRAAIERALHAIKHLPPVQRQDAVARLCDLCGTRELTDRLMMTTDQVRSLARGGMQVGAHTQTHPILCKSDDDQSRQEIQGSKRLLEAMLDQPVSLFAYPNGKPGADYDARHVAMVREAGFAAAVSTAPGSADGHSDLLQLPRFTPWDRQATRFGLRMLGNCMADGQRCA